ncbi:MAG: HugZ family protein [Oligoflexales bacterium]
MTQKESSRKLFHFLNSHPSGVLATQSATMPDYPFASAVTYCLDENGNPVILISHLAEHTKNLKHSTKTSLCITESLEPSEMQSATRVTLVGNAVPLGQPSDYVKDRYFGFFPKQRNYLRLGGFEFYKLEVSRVRFIGGFGDVTWIDYDRNHYSFSWSADAASVIKHMSEDHQDVIDKAGRKLRISGKCQMAAVDSTGFHIRGENQLGFLAFDEECNILQNLRETFMKTAKKLAG